MGVYLDGHIEAGGHDTCRVGGPVTHVYPGDGERVSSPRVARRHLAQAGLLPPRQLAPRHRRHQGPDQHLGQYYTGLIGLMYVVFR